jgi:transposase-like protein
LEVSTFQGFRLWFFQMHTLVYLPIPNRSAIGPLEDGALALADLGQSGPAGSSGLDVGLRHDSSMGYPLREDRAMSEASKPLSHPSQRRYRAELRERATRMVLEVHATGERYEVVSHIARQLGIEPSRSLVWVQQDLVFGLAPDQAHRHDLSQLASGTPQGGVTTFLLTQRALRSFTW